MRILTLSNVYPPDIIGGYEIACAHAVEGLKRRGHDLRVLTSVPRRPVPHDPTVRRDFKLADLWDDAVLDRTLPAAKFQRLAESHWVSAFNVHALLRHLEEFRPDVVYVSNLTGLGGLGLMATLRHLRVPWVWQLGDSVPSTLCTRWDGPLPELARRLSHHFRGRYIVVSKQLIDEIEQSGYVLEGEVRQLPYWIAGELPPPRAESWQGGPLRIAFAGVIRRQKGVGILIEAAELLRKRGYGPDRVTFDLFGAVSDPTLRAEAQARDVGAMFRFRGHLPQRELLGKLREFDLFAFPTWAREPFGMTPLEAAAVGCVPIISRVCGIAEWFVHGVHMLKAERTPEAFARIIRGILEGLIDLGPIARHGSEIVRREFHLDAILPRIESFLAEAANDDRSGAGSADEIHHLAILAEKLAQVYVQEALSA